MLDTESNGGKGIRTPGLLIANETLYQLSYTPIEKVDGLVSAERGPTQEAFEEPISGEALGLAI